MVSLPRMAGVMDYPVPAVPMGAHSVSILGYPHHFTSPPLEGLRAQRLSRYRIYHRTKVMTLYIIES